MVKKQSKRLAQAAATRQPAPWWQSGVIYQIYVRSFCDSNGDGIGDLAGVCSKLDYLVDLGVSAVWLSPVTVSSNYDWGYDVVDYCDIDPHLGTMDDFDRLIHEAGKRNIKILLDLVPNHTSVYHPWFQNALTGRDSKYRDYYVWHDPKPSGKPPSNWRSSFGGSAWKFHRPTGQYYLHNFLPQQPDLNWRNPAVKREFDKIMKFWLNRGIAGFRLDVFNMLIKDQLFRDNPASVAGDGLELRLLGQDPVYTTSRPEIHGILRHWRDLVDGYDTRDSKLLLGEDTFVYNIQQLAAFYGKHDELQLAFNFAFLQSKFSANSLRRIVEETEGALAYPDSPVWTSSNHDQPRFPSRWAHGDERKIRCGLLMLLTLRGASVLYYGDELGMGSVWVPPWRMRDPFGRKFWPAYDGRDKARTPMLWNSQADGGFSEPGVSPWLPLGRSRSRNVDAQQKNAGSTWNFTRDLIALRRRHQHLQTGPYQTLPSPHHVWAWLRGDHMATVINFSNLPTTVDGLVGKVSICTNRRQDGKELTGSVLLAPWEGMVVHLHRRPPGL